MDKNVVMSDLDFQRVSRNGKSEENEASNFTFWQAAKKELKNNKGACICLGIIGVLIILSLAAPLSPYDPDAIDKAQKLQGISWSHWFGTDEFGRDYFTRALYGGRISLTIGFCTMIISTAIGTFLGMLSGYIGGKLDIVLMQIINMFLAIPSMLLMLAINAILNPGLVTLIFVLSFFSWTSVARIARAETMTLKERDYVKAAQNLGASTGRILIKHILPNILGSVSVAATLSVAGAIIMESTLSFLGLGVKVPIASWGSMLQGAQSYILNNPRLAILPGVMILLTVLSFNVIGDALRNILEPKIMK